MREIYCIFLEHIVSCEIYIYIFIYKIHTCTLTPLKLAFVTLDPSPTTIWVQRDHLFSLILVFTS
jgi:hypothetical protein